MANHAELLLEAERRGILPPEKVSALAEARRRGLIQETSTPTEVPRGTVQTAQEREKLNREMGHQTKPISKETRAVRELPELGSGGLLAGEDLTKTAALSPLLLMTSDPYEIGEILKSNFKNIKITEDEGGNLIANNTKTGVQVVINKPGISKLDVLQGLGMVAAFTPAGRVATIGTAGVKAGLGMATRRGVQGGAASALTETAIQTGQKVAGGTFDPEEIAAAGGFGTAAEFVVPGIQAIRSVKQTKRLKSQQIEGRGTQAVIEAEAAQQSLEVSTRKKVRLFRGQKTLDPSQLEEQSLVAALSSGAVKARKELQLQNKEIGEVVDEVLNIIAPPGSIETGAIKVRAAAQKRLENLEGIREKRSGPFFKKAFRKATEEGVKIDTRPIISHIDKRLNLAAEGTTLNKTLQRIKKIISSKPIITPEIKSNLERLQKSKFELDSMLEGPQATSLDSTVKREIQIIKKMLVDLMEKKSKLYKRANKVYEKNSPAIEKFKSTILGKVTKIDDTQLKSISTKIFDAAETNPTVILKSKKVIESIDPNAWKEITRTELERRIGSIRADLEDPSTIENIPGQLFSAIFGKKKQRAILFAGSDGTARNNLKWLETLLSRARLGRPGGSQTAAREEIKKRLNRGVVAAIEKFIRRPITAVAGTGEEVLFEARTKALADIVYNPKWKSRIDRIKEFKVDSPPAMRAMTQLLRDAESSNNVSEKPSQGGK